MSSRTDLADAAATGPVPPGPAHAPRGAWRSYLRSPQLGALLVGLLALLCLAGAVVPQEAAGAGAGPGPDAIRPAPPAWTAAARAVGLTEVFTSPVFYLVAALLVLNLALCCATRGAALVRARTPLSSPRWGSLLFHAAIPWCLLCGLYGRLARFEGYVELGEGQYAVEAHESYAHVAEGPLFACDHAGFAFGLERLSAPRHRRDRSADRKCEIVIRAGDAPLVRGTIEPLEPLAYGGYRICQMRGFGPALLFQYRHAGGVAHLGFVHLPLPAEAGAEQLVDFAVPGTSTRLQGTFRAAAGAPRLTLQLAGPDGPPQRHELGIGGQVAVSGGTLTFLDVRGWCGLLVVRDGSAGPLLAGICAGALGLVWMTARRTRDRS